MKCKPAELSNDQASFLADEPLSISAAENFHQSGENFDFALFQPANDENAMLGILCEKKMLKRTIFDESEI